MRRFPSKGRSRAMLIRRLSLAAITTFLMMLSFAHLAAADDSTAVRTTSGKVRCIVSADNAVCETYAPENGGSFPQAPLVPSEPGKTSRANIVNFNASGGLRWGFGDIPGSEPEKDIVLAYGQTYRMNGWTIAASADGTRFTNDQTGHGMFVSIDGVSTF